MIRRLYIKIFLMVLLVVLVTEVIVFALFRSVSDMGQRSRRANGQTLAAVRLVEDAWRMDGGRSGEALREVVAFLGKSFDAEVWITSSTGLVLAGPQTLTPVTPAPVRQLPDLGVKRNNDGTLYANAPVVLPGGKEVRLHLLYSGKEEREQESIFLQGLLHICLAVAVLIIPVSWIITGPLKRLNVAVLHFAEGNLSVRATETGADEIGTLARSFNHMAESLQRMLQAGRELTANVSHELRSPLARLRMSLELASDASRKPERTALSRHLGCMAEEIEHMDGLIGRILLMSKINLSQDISFCKGPVDIAELASAVLARHRPAMEARRLVLSISLPDPLTIYADAESVTDALENVFGNAAKFTPGGGTVAVTLRDEGCWARLDVVNTADALAEEELERIFHPFHRGERKSAEGAGLGLAIARKAMERNQGWISASNMDQGLSFSIRLPLCDLRGSGE